MRPLFMLLFASVVCAADQAVQAANVIDVTGIFGMLALKMAPMMGVVVGLFLAFLVVKKGMKWGALMDADERARQANIFATDRTADGRRVIYTRLDGKTLSKVDGGRWRRSRGPEEF